MTPRRPSSHRPHAGPEHRKGPGARIGARRWRRGFTLTESLIASVVLAACVVGIGGTLGASMKNSQKLDENAVGAMLARQMIEEILSRKYTDGAGAADSIYDYRDRTWSAATSFTTSDGSSVTLPGGGTYTRASDVDYYEQIADIDGPAETTVSGSAPPPIAIVTVTVTTPGNKVVTLTQLVVDKS